MQPLVRARGISKGKTNKNEIEIPTTLRHKKESI